MLAFAKDVDCQIKHPRHSDILLFIAYVQVFTRALLMPIPVCHSVRGRSYRMLALKVKLRLSPGVSTGSAHLISITGSVSETSNTPDASCL